jgi:hypothetical protein
MLRLEGFCWPDAADALAAGSRLAALVTAPLERGTGPVNEAIDRYRPSPALQRS